METAQIGDRKGMTERCSVVLYWAAWCFLGVNVFVNILSLFFIRDWPERWSTWKIVLTLIRQNSYHLYYMVVLFGISAALKVGNTIARQLDKLNAG